MDHNKHDTKEANGGTGGHGMDHGSAKDFLRRFWIVTLLLIPLLLTSDFALKGLGWELGAVAKWFQFGIATIIFGFSLIFFKHAWHEIKGKAYGMMTLVSVAVAAGYTYSVAATFIPALEADFYLEISSLIWVLLFGHYLEARSSSAAGSALQEIAKLLPQSAHLIENGEEKEVSVSTLKIDDIVLVKPGEKIPADGEILDGSAAVDESLISGESKPTTKIKGDAVVAGSICIDGSLTVKLKRVGEHSTVGQIKQLILEAQKTKPRSQRIADKASAVLTFVAGGLALMTILVWTVFLGEPFVFGITLAITVLVIACPHALGLAIPTVTTIATQLATKNGLFIKDLSKIEAIRNVDVVVFDKTGTLTEGSFGVNEIVVDASYGENDLLQIAASLESNSSHVIGRSIVDYSKEKGLKLSKTEEFKNIAGKGLEGKIDGTLYKVGNQTTAEGLSTSSEMKDAISRLQNEVYTLAFVSNSESVLGVIAMSDEIKEESGAAVKAFQDMGVRVVMLTGDNEEVAKATAAALNIKSYYSQVLPEDKYLKIKELQKDGSSVLMVGDGVNDAPALTQADVGVAIGAGTDIAVEAGDVVLTRNNPIDVVRLIKLSKSVYRKMIQNLVWALGYNIIALPAAAGAFAVWGFFLRPEIGAFVMSLSTVIVVANALTLKRVNLD